MPIVPPLRPMILVRVIGGVLATVLVALATATPAWAHNRLISSDPPPSAVLDTPPKQVVLQFAERLDPRYTTIVVTGADQRPVPTDQPTVADTRGTVAFAQPLTPGTYTVAYRVVSTDGHPVQGSYSFTVAGAQSTPPASSPPDASASPAQSVESASPADPTPSVEATAAAEPTTDETDTGPATAAIVAVLAVLALGGGFLLWRRLGRR